jgi:acetyl esterase/lipase
VAQYEQELILKRSKRWRTMAWVLGTLVAITIVAAVALQVAIARNGPAVLNATDRVTGGNGGSAVLAQTSFGPSQAQKILVYGPTAQAETPLPVLMFMHGGSWRSGDPDDYTFIARSFVSEGFVVVLAGYRLYPEAVFPGMLEDTASAIAWAKQNIANLGGNPDHIVLAGHSAGAYNVVMAALDEKWLAQQGLQSGDIRGVVGLSGPYDFYPFDSESTINAFGSHDAPEETQPVNYVQPDAPPMLLIHGEQDTLVYPRNTRELARLSNRAGSGVEVIFYPEMSHNDPLIALASPWRGRNDLHQAVVDFARDPVIKPNSSLPVQPE